MWRNKLHTNLLRMCASGSPGSDKFDTWRNELHVDLVRMAVKKDSDPNDAIQEFPPHYAPWRPLQRIRTRFWASTFVFEVRWEFFHWSCV